jgi:hypothetical protein
MTDPVMTDPVTPVYVPPIVPPLPRRVKNKPAVLWMFGIGAVALLACGGLYDSLHRRPPPPARATVDSSASVVGPGDAHQKP